MTDTLRAARSRQLARLPERQKPPAPRAALAMAKAKAYQASADAWLMISAGNRWR